MTDTTLDPSFMKDLAEAQRIAQEACAAAFAALTEGMSHDDIADFLTAQVQSQGAIIEDQPLVHMGDETGGGFLSRALRARPITPGEVVSLAVRPVIGNAVGEFGDTQVFGENGRYWQFRRMAYRIYQIFLEALGSCKTERDIIRLADESAYQRGFTLFHPLSGSIAHPIRPSDVKAERHKHHKSIVTNRLRRLIPGGDRAFEGPWCIEPRFLVDDVGYLFKAVVMPHEGGAIEVLGGPLPQGVPTGPWLA